MELDVRLGHVVASHVCHNLVCPLAGVDQSPRDWTMREAAWEVGRTERAEAEQGRPVGGRKCGIGLRALQATFARNGMESLAKPGRPPKTRTRERRAEHADTSLPEPKMFPCHWAERLLEEETMKSLRGGVSYGAWNWGIDA